jgi:hypothetical protein
VPNIPAGTSVADATTWLESAIATRAGAVAQLQSTVNASTTITTVVRSQLLRLVGTANATLESLAAKVPTDTTLRAVRQDAATTIGLHVFAVLLPQVDAIIVASTVHNSAAQLLGQESSIRAAVAAARSARLPIGDASARLTAFRADLVQAKSLTAKATATLFALSTSRAAQAGATITNEAGPEATATSLVASAKLEESAIVSLLASSATTTTR